MLTLFSEIWLAEPSSTSSTNLTDKNHHHASQESTDQDQQGNWESSWELQERQRCQEGCDWGSEVQMCDVQLGHAEPRDVQAAFREQAPQESAAGGVEEVEAEVGDWPRI